MIKLIFTTPNFAGQCFQLPEGRTTVGRADDNTLIIEDESLSAIHCEILRYGREIIVRDTGSANGTWVDDSPIKGQTSVGHGQRIRFGRVETRLDLPRPAFKEHHTEMTAIHLLSRATRDAVAEAPQPVIIKRCG